MDIKSIAKYAYQNVPMYVRKNISNLDKFEDYPLIEKNYVIENESGAIAPDSVMLYYNNELMKVRTSGSTGKYLEVYWKKADYSKSMLPLWLLRKKYYGISPEDKVCFFYTIMKLGDIEEDVVNEKNQRGYSKSNLTIEKLKEIYMDMQEFNPKWMLLQPSIAHLLCKCIDKFELEKLKDLEYIEMSGEILTKEIREEVEKTFGCKVSNQYGANEFNSIAYECPFGNMHVVTSNVYAEVIKDEKVVYDEEGIIYLTSKTNTAMPFIRYGIGDTGIMCTQNECLCGNKRPILKLTSGRANDYVLTSTGRKTTSYVFVRAIDNVNYVTEGVIKQFQIIQKALDEFTIKLVVDEEEYCNNDEMENLLIKSINDEEIRKCKFEFEYFGDMFPECVKINNEGRFEGGKFAYFKREFE